LYHNVNGGTLQLVAKEKTQSQLTRVTDWVTAIYWGRRTQLAEGRRHFAAHRREVPSHSSQKGKNDTAHKGGQYFTAHRRGTLFRSSQKREEQCSS